MEAPPVNDQPLSGRRVVLGVSASIAAYKAADVASQLGHLGADVHVILTKHAEEFVGSATFRALTRNPVLSGVFDEPFDRQIAHIQLAQESDLILLAPATANLLAKMAHGIADDLLTTVLLAATVPVMAAPAMNSAMLDHPATQANIELLRSRGVMFVDPAYGLLACRTEGWGKLADVQTIITAVTEHFRKAKDLEGYRVVVTAGATREPIDPVRFLSNRSSGKMGYAIAEAAALRGAEVTLVSGAASVTPPGNVAVVSVSTTEEMLRACEQAFAGCDLFIAAAAPSDYTAEEVAASKIKKGKAGQGFVLRLRETPDIVATLATRKKRQVVVGFAAETDDLLANAREKLVRKKLDLIVANDVTADGAGFGTETNVVTFLWPDGRTESLPTMPKREVAGRLLDTVRPLLPSK
jgi:phosphopantothenoylcysteine decarboxylase / phosphopantothenate---cysteine ligase